MDDMNAFERQVAGAMSRSGGPVRPVDDLAIFTAIATQQSPKWRFQSTFSAAKFVVAGVIVALFGGFLLTGVLTQQGVEPMPAVGASASASTRPDTTAEPTAATESMRPITRTDILPGVSLLTQELEPGVLRILGDDVGHDLTQGHPDGVPYLLDIAISPDGTPWIADWDPVGDGARVWALGQRGTYDIASQEDWEPSALLAEPDGTITAVSRSGIFSFDGEGFTPNPGSRRWEAPDGEIWIFDRETLMDATEVQGGPRMSVRDPGALALFWPRGQGTYFPTGEWHFARDRGSFLHLPGDGRVGSHWDMCGCGDHERDRSNPQEGVFFYKDAGSVEGSGPDAHYLADTYIETLRLAPDGSIWAIGDTDEETDSLYRIDPAELAQP